MFRRSPPIVHLIISSQSRLYTYTHFSLLVQNPKACLPSLTARLPTRTHHFYMNNKSVGEINQESILGYQELCADSQSVSSIPDARLHFSWTPHRQRQCRADAATCLSLMGPLSGACGRALWSRSFLLDADIEEQRRQYGWNELGHTPHGYLLLPLFLDWMGNCRACGGMD